MSGPGDGTAAAESRSRGDLRAGHADREQVIRTLKGAFVEMQTAADAQKAINGLNFADFDGRLMSVYRTVAAVLAH